MYKHHSLEIKLSAISLYESGQGSIAIGQRLCVDDSLVRRWIRIYRQKGKSGLAKQNYTHTTSDFRREVADIVLKKGLSCQSVALEYGISESSVYCWVQKFKSGGYGALSETKPRGRPPKVMGRPKKREAQTELEKLQEENARLRAENALLKKVKALVEEREARLRATGCKPSKD